MLRACTIAYIALMTLAARAEDWTPKKGPLTTRWAKDVSPDERASRISAARRWSARTGRISTACGSSPSPSPGEQAPIGQGPGRQDSRAVSRRVGAVRRDAAGRAALVSPHLRGSRGVEGQARAPALRRGRLGSAVVFVNGKQLGAHRGGYDAFSFDITDALTSRRPAGAGRRRLRSHRRAARSRAASRSTSPAASGTRPPPASGRPCGWSRCRRAYIDSAARSRPTSTPRACVCVAGCRREPDDVQSIAAVRDGEQRSRRGVRARSARTSH